MKEIFKMSEYATKTFQQVATVEGLKQLFENGITHPIFIICVDVAFQNSRRGSRNALAKVCRQA